MPSQTTANAQGQEVDYALNTLGWKSFQDLCLTVLGEVLGQTVQSFSPVHDGGRDGAFQGEWKPNAHQLMAGPCVIQCKYSNIAHKNLTVGDLNDELPKVAKLAARGLAQNYILITNFKISGRQEAEISTRLKTNYGINEVLLFGKEWLTQKIRESRRLRMLVPRLYGLGDLSQILDERAYEQAQDILSVLGDDLGKFVITDAYRKSANALLKYGFVLLLGEPASGKSIIAASLSMGAIDVWNCSTLKIVNADDFKRHWNPHEPQQCFWVDDVFGVTQYQRHKADEWNSVFLHLNAAIKKGARVIFTSRDYIFRSARADLKRSAFPLLEESQVVINVQSLSEAEKGRILYNHLRKGTQPVEFRRELKQHLPAIVDSAHLSPEICRRLGNPLFTKGLNLTRENVLKYVEQPHQFLLDVIQTLDSDNKGALTLIFMRGGALASPIQLSKNEETALSRIGTSLAGVTSALRALEGSLTKYRRSEGQFQWAFKHPTIADALATDIANDHELLDIYLGYTKIERLFEEITCGDTNVHGVKVILPAGYYGIVLKRLDEIRQMSRLYEFLAQRCDDLFLRLWADTNSEFMDDIIREDTPSNYDSNPELVLLSRLNDLGLLSDNVRSHLVEQVREWASDSEPYWRFLNDHYVSKILSEDEKRDILNTVKRNFVEKIEKHIHHWRYNLHFIPKLSLEETFQELFEALSQYEDAFREYGFDSVDTRIARHIIEETIEEMNYDWHDESELDYKDFVRQEHELGSVFNERSIFDDVDS